MPGEVHVPPVLIPPGLTFWQGLQKGYVPLFECPRYLAYVATLPCCVSGRGGVTVHHIVGHGLKAIGGKTHDLLAIPLAADLHLPNYPDGLHTLGHKAWEARFGSQLEFSTRTLLQAVYDRVLRL